MRIQTAIGIALAALATAALAQVADTPGQGNTANVRVDEAAPAANDTMPANQMQPANTSVPGNTTAVEEAASPSTPPPKR